MHYILKLAKFYLNYPPLITLRGWAREELVRLVSLNKVQPVLLQMCDYRSLSVNALLELANFYLNKPPLIMHY